MPHKSRKELDLGQLKATRKHKVMLGEFERDIAVEEAKNRGNPTKVHPEIMQINREINAKKTHKT